MGRIPDEGGLTIIQLVVAILLLVLITHILTMVFFPAPGKGNPSEGMIGTFAGESGYALRPVGSVTAFSAVDGDRSDVTIQYPRQDPGNLGAVQMTVGLFIGDMGGVDFDKVGLYWAGGGVVEKIPHKTVQPLVCPGWMITNRFDVPSPAPAASGKLPRNIPAAKGHGSKPAVASLTGADILYPEEQFELVICPANTTPPYQQFTITVNPPGSAQPPVAVLTAPPMVQPVIPLGLE